MDMTFDIETIPLPVEQRAFAKPTEDSVKYGNAKKPEKRQEIFEQALADEHFQLVGMAGVGARARAELAL